MRAAVYHGREGGLVVEEVDRPSPAAGEALVEVAGCGFCHTDLHYLDHGVATAKPPPIILGHEISGRVAEVNGSGRWKAGDRVIVPAVLPCGECAYCRSGRENICPALQMLGNHVDGGFAEFVRVPGRHLIPLPEGIDLVRGSVIADALSTPYHAVVNRARVREGEWVVVIGCGGVGINVVQFAALAGAHVLAVDLQDEKLALARSLGAADTFNPSKSAEAGAEIRRRTEGGADVAFEAVGAPPTIDLAFGSVRRGGRICLVGYSSKPATLPASRVMFLEYSVVGSLGCRPVDYPRIVELVRRGRVRLDPIVTRTLPLERVAEAAELLRRGEGLRTVLCP